MWHLIDIVSKNGNLLLNIGPKSDGTIPEEAKSILQHMGAWLNVNGEAIYGTRPWTTYGEGPTKVAVGSFQDAATKPYTPQDIRFTTRGKTLYAIAMGWPTDGNLLIHSLGSGISFKVGSVSLLGSDEKIHFEQEGDGLHLKLPAHTRICMHTASRFCLPANNRWAQRRCVSVRLVILSTTFAFHIKTPESACNEPITLQCGTSPDDCRPRIPSRASSSRGRSTPAKDRAADHRGWSRGHCRDAHLPAYRKAGFPVAALVDANLRKAAALAESFSVPLATNSLNEAISKSPKRQRI